MHNPFKEEEKNKINIFINLALEFNKTHNIFSRKEHDEVYKKDILDCEPLVKRIKNNITGMLSKESDFSLNLYGEGKASKAIVETLL